LLNAPGPEADRRGATAPPRDINSLVFFGGIVVAVVAVTAGALAIWGPDKDVTHTQHLASDPQPSPFDSAPTSSADPAPSETIAPPVAEIGSGDPAPADSVPKKGKGKRGKKKR